MPNAWLAPKGPAAMTAEAYAADGVALASVADLAAMDDTRRGPDGDLWKMVGTAYGQTFWLNVSFAARQQAAIEATPLKLDFPTDEWSRPVHHPLLEFFPPRKHGIIVNGVL